MKKAFFTGFLGIAFAFCMVACNGNANTNEPEAEPTCEQSEEHACMQHCQMTCPDSVCLANNCENCTCPEDSPCHKKEACKGDGQCCKKEGNCCKEGAAAEGCCKEGAKPCEGHGDKPCCKKEAECK